MFTISYWSLQTADDAVANLKHGLYACAFLFVILGSMVFPSGPFVRPHPIFWRLVFSLSTIYVLCLTWFVFQTPDQMRETLKFFDPELGKPLPPKSYAEDCSFTREAFSDKFDLFLLAHFLGLDGKSNYNT
eukprot:UN33592